MLLFVSDDLDSGLAWCEDVLLAEEFKKAKLILGSQHSNSNLSTNFNSNTSNSNNNNTSPMKEIPLHLQQIYNLANEPYVLINEMMNYFSKLSVDNNTTLWQKGLAIIIFIIIIIISYYSYYYY